MAAVSEYGWRATVDPGVYIIVDETGTDVGMVSFLPSVARPGLMMTVACVAWSESGLIDS
jgi:hypothetical protein